MRPQTPAWVAGGLALLLSAAGAVGQGNFAQWFSAAAFGGTNYENTPVAAVSHTDEPRLNYVNDTSKYLGLWSAGKTFGICAWYSRRTDLFQALGDPFVRR